MTPCKTENCERRRYANSSLCFLHYKEKDRLKRDKRVKRRLDRKLASKWYQKSERKKWHAKTWKLMSEWVRRKDTDWKGEVGCYTCFTRLPWKEANCGHWRHGVLDLDIRNLKPQCPKCNLYLSGRLDVYTMNLVREMGTDWVLQLQRDADRHPGYTLEEIKAIHALLKIKLEEL